MDARKPNIFEYATSELSQDAFICWLVAWADPKYHAEQTALHKTATEFLNRLFTLGNVCAPTSYESVTVKRQYCHIDVLVLVNGVFAIVIEDKIFTGHHSNQLDRYAATPLDNVQAANTAFIYLKTGDQSNYDDLEGKRFVPYKRADFLALLEAGERLGVTNDIFHDFHDNLRKLEQLVLSYKSTPLSDWDRNCWTGFFIELQRQLCDGQWGEINHRGDSFMGFWLPLHASKYLQLEEDKLCFKIAVDDPKQRGASWDMWYDEVTAANSTALALRKSARRIGESMTVLVVDGGYLRARPNGLVDVAQSIAVIRCAKQILDCATSSNEFDH